jgi:pimeloyl-ACP methyl ester carboxylesterase
MKYIKFFVPFLWGLFLDTLIMPLVALMFLIKYFYTSELDNLFSHNKKLPPMLLIHGSGSNEAQWLLTRFYLRKHFNLYSVQLNSLPADKHYSIADYTSHVLFKINKIINDYDDNIKITLVGHSMGGLVASYYAEWNPKYISQIVTIGTPWKGAPALNYINMKTQRHKEMTPDSDLLNCLYRRLENSNNKYICLGSIYDFQVPYDYSYPDTKNIISVKYSLGHTSAVAFPFIWKKILPLLK